MSKSLRMLALGGLTSLWAVAAFAHGPYGGPGDQRPPSGVVRVSAAGERLTLWPYTTSDFETPSDPINLVFPNADPREIRQELMKPKGARGPFAAVPGANCQWTDAMGYEQAAWGLPERWVGGAVQLACVPDGAPLGGPFRFHVRLFRAGRHTIANAHYEILIPGTAEHEVLSWDLARNFVANDMGLTGTVVPPPQEVPMIPGPSFRAVRRPVYDALRGPDPVPPTTLYFLGTILGLVPPADPALDVPIPTSGKAVALVTAIDFEPVRAHAVTTTQVTYNITVPKPFCATGSYDFVKLEGPLQFTMSVSTGSSGRYERTYSLGGTLGATPMVPTSPTTFVPVGPKVDASIFEIHSGALDDRHGQVTEKVQQSLLGDPFQTMAWSFAAGDTDRFVRNAVCGTE
jgi:hypothetical protein